MKQKLTLQEEINSLLQLETSTFFYQKWTIPMQKISKYTIELNSSIIQLDVIDIYRLLHPTVEN